MRYAILRLIELQEARGATYLQDADIAAALGAAVREVQEQLEARAMSPTSVRTIPDADTVASTPESAASLRGQTAWISIVRALLEILLHSWKGTCCSVRARVRKERVSVN